MKRKFWVKALAFALCTLTVIFTVMAAVGTAFMAAGDFYISDFSEIRHDVIRNMAYTYAHRVWQDFWWGGYDSPRSDIKNFSFEIYDSNGVFVLGDYGGEETYLNISEDFFAEIWEDATSSERETETANDDTDASAVTVSTEITETDTAFYENEADIPYDSDYFYGGPYVNGDEYDEYLNTYENDIDTSYILRTETYTVKVYVPTEFTKTDVVSFVDYWLSVSYKWRFMLPVLGAVALIVSIILVVFLAHAAGAREGEENVHESVFDRIPFDLFTALYAIGILLVCCILSEGSFGFSVMLILIALCAAVGVPLVLSYFMSIAVRAKAGTLFKNTIIFYVIRAVWHAVRFVGRAARHVLHSLPLYAKTVICLAVAFIWSVIVISLAASMDIEIAVILLVLGLLAFGALALYVTWMLLRLKKGGASIASGNLDSQIDTSYMLPEFKEHGEALNHIGEGMTRAVEDRIKSERFKTELITNVSHDLKTPLTSIVNYVGLLKAERESENPDEEKTNEYIEVLERQSARLRKLTEDLVEASKASSGNLEVKKEPCDLGEFLSQVGGEYGERLRAAGLEPVLRLPDSAVTIQADGRHLWRILDNLISNVIKYALAGTRVYFDLYEKNGRSFIVLRNTSKYPLNISADELSERFVRGDVSRHSEGSGLGLSIAKSLTELQDGKMEIYVDGDLFKVTLEFPSLKCDLPKKTEKENEQN